MIQTRNWKHRVSVLLLTGCLFCSTVVPVFAAEEQDAAGSWEVPVEVAEAPGAVWGAPEETPEIPEATEPVEDRDRDEVLRDLMSTNPEDALEPITQKPAVPETSFRKQFAWQDGFSLSGIFETRTLYFKVPNYWQTEYVYGQVAFTLSQMIQDVPASLTFMVNEQPVYSCKLDYRNGRQQIVYVPIPVNLLREGFNTFDITGYVRIYDDEGCIDDFSGANWVYIDTETFVEVGYELLPHNELISYYPYPFMSTADRSGSNTQVLVSDRVDSQELAAALLLRTDLASEAEKNDAITLVPFAQRKDIGDVGGSVLVSKTQNLPAQYQTVLTDADAQRLAASALVRFTQDENGDPILLIVSDDGSCLMEAAMMLVDESRSSQIHKNTTWVKSGSAQLVKEASKISDLVVGRYTVEGITDGGVNFFGPFHKEAYINLPFSGGYVISGASKVVLKFRYSKNLDFDRSLITVSWGNVPVASKKLTAELANDDELSFFMPTDVLGTNASSIKISFDLELPDLFCTPRMDEMPWAYVTGDSSFYFPLGTSGELSFKLRPFPFEVSSSFHDLMIVISDQPTTEELDTLGQVLTLYGESVNPYGDLKVIHAGEFSKEDADYNIITVGTFQDNTFIQSLNPRLSFAYEEDGQQFASNSSLILSEDYASDIGVMQLLRSPYAEKRAILVASAVDDQTLGYISKFISIDSNAWKLDKDAVLFDSRDGIKLFQILDQEANVSELTLKEYVQQNRESILFAVISTSAMLLILLAVILIFLRMYGRGKEAKKHKK